jgi:hypothetical protein
MAGADRTADQRRADAAVEAFKRAAGADAATGRRARPTIGVTTTYQRLINDLDDHYDPDEICELHDGTPISGAALRQLACEADIIPIVLGGDAMALDVGRGHRTATWAQRIALRARYTTCADPDGCDRPFDWCRRRPEGGARGNSHHIIPWEHGGPARGGRLRYRPWDHQPRITVQRTPRPGQPRRPELNLN